MPDTAAMMPGLRGLAARIGLALWLGMLGAGAAAETFRVGAGDRLSITVFRRPDLSGEFRVLPGGAVSLPFIGTMPVAGKSIDEIRQALAQRLREEASLLDPRVAVEIAEFQPILVAGDVRRPGQVPFAPGTTVGHAVASAGGIRRFNLEEIGARIEIVRLRERLRQTQETYGGLLVRRARFMAELNGADAFEPPPEVSRFLVPDRVREAREAELQMMRHRTAAYTTTLAMLTNQTGAYNEEIQALTEQSGSKDREQRTIEQEQEFVASLMRQGLTARDARVMQLSRAVIQLDGDRRQIAAFAARARQEVARIEQTRANATHQRQLEIATSLKDIDDTLAGLRVGMEEMRAGLAELRETLPGDETPIGPRSGTAYSVLRTRGGAPQRIPVEADTPLLPGDLVEVSTDAAGSDGRLPTGLRN